MLGDEHPPNISQAASAATHGTWRCPSAVSAGQQAALQHPVGTPQGESPLGRKTPVVVAQGPVGTGSGGLPLQPRGWAKEREMLGQEVLPGKVKGSIALLLTFRNVSINSLLQ